MRPLLKGDTFYFPTSEGVYLRNNQGSTFLKGKSLARLLDILTPHLDGTHTLEEITNKLSHDRQTVIGSVVATLLARGFVKDLSQDLPHHLTSAELHAYQSEIAFIRSFTDSAAARFERYRTSKILLIGAGLTLTALVHANLHSGMRQVNVLLTEECATHQQRLQEYTELYQERDDQQAVHVLEGIDWSSEEALQELLAPFDTVLTISDRSMLARTQLLQRLCWQQKKLFIAAVAAHDEFWLGPLALPGQQGCWECAWRRLQTNTPPEKSDAYAFVDHPDQVGSQFIAAPTAAIVANLLNFEVFKQITDAGPRETLASLLTIDLETAQSQRQSFLPSPLCQTCIAELPATPEFFMRYVQTQMSRLPQTQEDFSQRAVPLFDDRLGLFNTVDELNFTQMPCNVAQITFMPLIRPSEPLQVFGSGTSFGMARREATLRACELYAASFYDPLRSLTFEQVKSSTLPLFSASASAPDVSYLWAYDLQTKQVSAVDAGLAYPGLNHSLKTDELLSGVAAGLSWDEATTLALFSHHTHRAVAQIQYAQEPYPRVELDIDLLTDISLRFCEILDILQIKPEVYDITGAQGIPTFAFCSGERTVAYHSHLDVPRALEHGLSALVLAAQAAKNHEIEYAPLPVLDLPLDLRGKVASIPRYPTYQSWQEMQQVTLHFLPDKHVLAIPLDHDPALHSVLPAIVRVVLRNAHDGE